jgi:hypothetical protein
VGVYHVELSQDSTQVRAFNLSREQLRQRFLGPLTGGRRFVCEDKEFDPAATTLRVLEGPELGLSQLTLGRGWTEAERLSRDVTYRFLAETDSTAAHDGGVRPVLKERILRRVSAGPARLCELPALVTELMPGQRASLQLAEAELAVWELLHRQQLTLLTGSEPVAQDDWEGVLLDAGSWFGDPPISVRRPNRPAAGS